MRGRPRRSSRMRVRSKKTSSVCQCPSWRSIHTRKPAAPSRRTSKLRSASSRSSSSLPRLIEGGNSTAGVCFEARSGRRSLRQPFAVLPPRLFDCREGRAGSSIVCAGGKVDQGGGPPGRADSRADPGVFERRGRGRGQRAHSGVHESRPRQLIVYRQYLPPELDASTGSGQYCSTIASDIIGK